MSTAPRVDIDLDQFGRDPYPTLARLRAEHPIAFVPQLGSTLITRRDDISACEKNVAVFSSHQPQGLMNRLMGHNMMRKDGAAHLAERKTIFPTISPKTAAGHWRGLFQRHANRIVDGLPPAASTDFCPAFALPFSAECLKSVTGLTNMRYQDMDAWSQAMIDGIANYAGDPAVDARCH
jgi:cytochrome P450